MEMFGYRCTLQTDTEVITYIADYLLRKQGLSLEELSAVIAAPFWSTIKAKDKTAQEQLRYLRTVFSSLLITGPFSIILGFEGGLMALNDRLKLRSMVVAEKEDNVFYRQRGGRDPGHGAGRRKPVCPRRRRAGDRSGEEGTILMGIDYISPQFEVIRSKERCTNCRICEKQCANGVHWFDEEKKIMASDESKCVNCQRCVCFCPTHALKIQKSGLAHSGKMITGMKKPSRSFTGRLGAAACFSLPWAIQSTSRSIGTIS